MHLCGLTQVIFSLVCCRLNIYTVLPPEHKINACMYINVGICMGTLVFDGFVFIPMQYAYIFQFHGCVYVMGVYTRLFSLWSLSVCMHMYAYAHVSFSCLGVCVYLCSCMYDHLHSRMDVVVCTREHTFVTVHMRTFEIP